MDDYIGRGLDGWTILKGVNCIRLRHDASKRIFTLRKVHDAMDYWDIYACSPRVDGPTSIGEWIARMKDLRSTLIAIGFLSGRNTIE
jgi:hypothetical protein